MFGSGLSREDGPVGASEQVWASVSLCEGPVPFCFYLTGVIFTDRFSSGIKSKIETQSFIETLC